MRKPILNVADEARLSCAGSAEEAEKRAAASKRCCRLFRRNGGTGTPPRGLKKRSIPVNHAQRKLQIVARNAQRPCLLACSEPNLHRQMFCDYAPSKRARRRAR